MSGEFNQPGMGVTGPTIIHGRLYDGTSFVRRVSARARFTALAAFLTVSRARMGIVISLLRQKPISIRLFGDEYCFEVYRTFTARHPKLPLFQRKSFGTALRDLNVPLEMVFDGAHFSSVRRRVRRAERLGYRVVAIDPNQSHEQIMRINASGAIRQGRQMRTDYLDPQKVAAYSAKHATNGSWYGVLDNEGTLRAYCHLALVGECCSYSRILGDPQKLADGIMYLLVHRTIVEMHQLHRRQGFPRWVMYDMYLGGLQGLREFKRRLGFCPNRVRWIWMQEAEIP